MNKIRVDLVSDFFSPSGYSAHAREVVRSLHSLVDLRLIDRKHDRMTVALEPEEQRLFGDLVAKDRRPEIRIQFETPEFFEPTEGIVNVGFTQWETTRIPSTDYKGNARNNWVTQMNRMDRMWTGCEFAAESFRASGVTVPVDVIYGPVDTDLYRPSLPEVETDISLDAQGNFVERSKRPFVLGMIAQWTLRKNIEAFLVTVFSRFKRGEVHVLLKAYGSVMDDSQSKVVEERVKQILNQWVKNPDAPQITIITEKLSDDDVARLYSSMDAYVSTSRGEGLCMPLVQAMSCGVVPIACGFSAPGEYIRDGVNGYLVGYQKTPAVGMNSPWYRYDQDWAEVDAHHLESKIRRLVSAGRDAPLVRQMAVRARNDIVQTMGLPVAGKRFLECIEQALSPVPA